MACHMKSTKTLKFCIEFLCPFLCGEQWNILSQRYVTCLFFFWPQITQFWKMLWCILHDSMVIYCYRSLQCPRVVSRLPQFNIKTFSEDTFQSAPPALCQHFCCLLLYFCKLWRFCTSNMYFHDTSRDTLQHTVNTLVPMLQPQIHETQEAHLVLIHETVHMHECVLWQLSAETQADTALQRQRTNYPWKKVERLKRQVGHYWRGKINLLNLLFNN